MQKHYVLLAFICFLGSTISAQQLQTKEVGTFAKAAFRYYANTDQHNSRIKIKDSFTQVKDGQASYHIVNFEKGGFVILSGSKSYHAVLGFSDTGMISFDNGERNDGFWGELSKHEDFVNRISKGEVKPSPLVRKEWDKLEKLANNEQTLKSISFTPVVGPLTTTKWKQSGYYNDLIPVDDETGDRGTNAGCVPIAIAQALRYYASPIPGAGSITYDDPRHGQLSADFCGQTFDYNSMPDTLSEPNDVLAKFIYEVGISMETQYDDRKTGTYRSKIPSALIYNFGFDQDLRWFTGTNSDRYSETLKTEFDAGRIVVMAAKSLDEDGRIRGGHCWIADGYGYTADNVEYVHMNWGWGGIDNGWFLDTPGTWVPHVDNAYDYDIGYYYYRTTYYNIKPAQEFCVSPNKNYIEIDSRDDYARMYNYRSESELAKFRYRESGTSQWVETNPTYENATLVNDLKEGTKYEYQTARNCCGSWSGFSDIAEFVTTGTAESEDDPDSRNCQRENSSELSVSAVKDNFAYIYTSQPNGRGINNQFRYRMRSGDNEWMETVITDSYFRALRNLSAGTSYEFQVNHECSTDNWSGYSESFEFTTTGTATNDDPNNPTDEVIDVNTDITCKKEDSSRMKTSSVRDHSAYVYTGRPNGKISNIFRYREVGAFDWIETDVENIHYRALRDLKAGTAYEYQVNHLCDTNNSSGFSSSHIFTTTGASDDTAGENNSEDDTEMKVDDSCQKEDQKEMKVSGVSDDFAYIYTRFPNGRVNNIFRYRRVGSNKWTVTEESSKHYRSLKGLSSNTSYEYQVNHNCAINAWSGWSDSYIFGTENLVASESISLRSRELPLPYESNSPEAKISVFPNPTSDLINILIISESRDDVLFNSTLELLDQTGRVIEESAINNHKEIQMNISQLAIGIYFLRYLDDNGNNVITRFIKI